MTITEENCITTYYKYSLELRYGCALVLVRRRTCEQTDNNNNNNSNKTTLKKES